MKSVSFPSSHDVLASSELPSDAFHEFSLHIVHIIMLAGTCIHNQCFHRPYALKESKAV